MIIDGYSAEDINNNAMKRMGHWINGDDKCPCCGKSKFEGLDADIYADWQPMFCPNCGAKMESNIEKRKPCINYEDGCEEWAGCPCVYYQSRK